ncbi:Tyrosine-protein kinase YwqD [Rubripirellula tenax]|uniref:non-specific protein-tyrosine kinase n=2 Tax=Rubripirellula tenax TaxID=2528015 RepID=A0A5C6FFI9_9BACT|nr:Tyrosine-protein kinase YwqD [Rubripirellula tenax]
MLRRRWFHLVLGTCLGIAFALLYFYATKPTYESHIEILVGQRSSELTTSGTMSNSQASGDTIQEDLLATHVQLLTSRLLISDAIATENLEKLPSIGAVVAGGDNAVDYIIENLDVARGGKGASKNAMVLSATFRDPNPDDAATILAAIYGSYERYVESHTQDTSREAAELIDAARIENEKELDAADREYREFISSVPVLLEGERVRDVHKTRLEQLESELNTVRTSLAEAKSRLKVIEAFTDENETSVNDFDKLALLSQKDVTRLKLFLDMTRGESQSETFQAEQPARAEAARAQYSRLLDLLQKERTLVSVYGVSHPLIKSTREEIDVIERFVAANAPAALEEEKSTMNPRTMLTTFTRLLKNDIAEYEMREAILVETSSEELQLAKDVENAFLEGNAKKAKVTRAQIRYDEVIRRLQELNLAGSYAGFSTDLLSNPEPAKSPAWPRLPIVLVLGSFLGFFLGIATGISAELLDTTFRDVEDLETTLQASAIAHVPLFNLRKLPIPSPDQTPLAPSLVTAHCPRSAEAEVYRVARTSLMIRADGSDTKVLMMSSPHPGDGKSTTISNLAISFAQAGKRVLLIDSDLRRPVIAGLFGVDGGRGLGDILMGEATLEDSTVASSVENLDILPHGKATSVPAELLQSNRMSVLVQEARRTYDLVLIDAPPVLAVADPSIVAPLADGVILTVRIAKNGRRPVEQAGRILNDNGIVPLALIVNGVDAGKRSSYGYGGYRANEYAYVGKYHNEYAASEPSSISTLPRVKGATKSATSSGSPNASRAVVLGSATPTLPGMASQKAALE